LYVDVVKLYN